MHTFSLLQRWFERNTTFMHEGRQASVLAAVEGLLCGGTLTLTHLGRSLRGAGHTKHKIKRIDRLLGNTPLHKECGPIYAALAGWLLNGVRRPVIVVDWSDCEPGHAWLMLTAALTVGGRALPVYQEVHRLSAYNSPGTHRRFLQALHAVVPRQCRPILITDAGFRGPWFRAVEQLGWDWIGRVRNRIKVRVEGAEPWRYTTALYREATRRVRHLGRCALSHKHPYVAHLYLVHLSRRGRGRPLKAHGRGPNAMRCRKLYRDPWLLASELPHAAGMGQRVIKLYAKRMQIEETFRDLKDERWGFGLAQARCSHHGRREVLLLIGALTLLALWLVGLAATTQGWMRHFQANTERRHAVLSLVFLGREVFNHSSYTLGIPALRAAFHQLRLMLRSQTSPV